MIRATAWLLLMVSGSAVLADGFSVTDTTGQELRFDRPAARVVTLSPHATELVYAVGGGQTLVGTVEFSNFPEAASQIPRIGTYERIDYERLLLLRPDVVIGWATGNPATILERVRQLKIPLYLSEPDGLAGIADDLRSIGKMLGRAEAGAQAAAAYRARLARLKQDNAGRREVSVFYQIWDKPLMTVNGAHLVSEVLSLCGGRNVFAGLDSLAPQVGVESVLKSDPEAIVVSGSGYENPAWLEFWRQWPALRAVAADNFIRANPDYMNRHTPRILDGAEFMCRELERIRARQR